MPTGRTEGATYAIASGLDLTFGMSAADRDPSSPGRADEDAVYKESNDEDDGFAHRNLPRARHIQHAGTLLARAGYVEDTQI